MHAQRKALVSGPPLLDESDNLVAIMHGGSTVEGSSIGKSVGISSLETTESKPSVKKPKHLSRLTNLSAKNWFQNNRSQKGRLRPETWQWKPLFCTAAVAERKTKTVRVSTVWRRKDKAPRFSRRQNLPFSGFLQELWLPNERIRSCERQMLLGVSIQRPAFVNMSRLESGRPRTEGLGREDTDTGQAGRSQRTKVTLLPGGHAQDVPNVAPLVH